MTEPDGTVVLDAVVTVPTVKFADVIALVAAVCVIDTTFGTMSIGRREDTTSTTARPDATWVPAHRFSLMDWPSGVFLPDVVVTVPTVKFADVIALVAAVCVIDTTFGT